MNLSKKRGVGACGLVLLLAGLAVGQSESKGDDAAKQSRSANAGATKAKAAKEANRGPTRPDRKPNPALQPIKDEPGLPRVLLIGDSISIGYTLPVRELLKGEANVHRPAANCGPTTAGLKGIEEWLATGSEPGKPAKNWDVIHFNWGLHDLKYIDAAGQLVSPSAGKQQVPPEEYEKNLTKLVERLKQTGATLIWRNTTPVPPGSSGRHPGDETKYNEIAARVMKAHGIRTHDLNAFITPIKDAQLPANVHYTPEGYRKLAEDVAAEIRRSLPKAKSE